MLIQSKQINVAAVVSDALVAAGTTTSDVSTSAERLGSGELVLSVALTSGTTQPISLADALFTGLVAGGAAGPGTGGTAGVVAGSFASGAAEVGTGANQGGLGSAAAADQPYNGADFPGGKFYGDLYRAGEPVLLLDALSTAAVTYPASVEAPVILFFSYRSDLGANLKWRGWFYFLNKATGLYTAFTPNVSLANCTLRAPRVLFQRAQPTAEGLSQNPAAPAAADVVFGPSLNSSPSKRNKGMAASTTTADHDEACSTALAATPAATTNSNGAYVKVEVNGIGYVVGDGVRTKDCYFSNDAGATARAFGAIAAGDKLYWNGSIAGFQLAASTEIIDFFYDEPPT